MATFEDALNHCKAKGPGVSLMTFANDSDYTITTA